MHGGAGGLRNCGDAGPLWGSGLEPLPEPLGPLRSHCGTQERPTGPQGPPRGLQGPPRGPQEAPGGLPEARKNQENAVLSTIFMFSASLELRTVIII